jgi:hypothetical protein
MTTTRSDERVCGLATGASHSGYLYGAACQINTIAFVAKHLGLHHGPASWAIA